MKKKHFLFMALFLLAFCQIKTNAATIQEQMILYEKEELDNGYYIETILTQNSTLPDRASILATSTKSGKKTAYCKNADGDVMWSISVHGTFTYNGTTSKCTAVSMSKTISNSNWTVSDTSSSKSGNTCKATGTGTLKASGVVIQSITKTITLKCAADGTLS